MHEGRVLVVHHVFRPDDSAQALEVGTLLTSHACALGKVLLAFDSAAPSVFSACPSPPDRIDGRPSARLARGLARSSSGTGRPRTASWWRARPAWRRRSGPAVLVVGAIGVSGLAERLYRSGEPRPQLVSYVREAAHAISTGSARAPFAGSPNRSPVARALAPRRRMPRVARECGMSRAYVAAIDQGTTSSRCIVFDRPRPAVRWRSASTSRSSRARAGSSTTPEEIWAQRRAGRRRGLRKLGVDVADLTALGITNQRETTVLWDRRTGGPVGTTRSSWQDTRTDRLVQELGGDAGPERFRELCGLPLATYFAGPEAALAAGPHRRAPRSAPSAARSLFGTMDSWLIWKLTGAARHRRDQRQPHDADEPRDARLGRRAARPPSTSRGHAPRDPLLDRGLRRGAGPARRRAGRRPRSATSRPPCSGRPASAAARRSAPTGPAASCS